LRDGGGEHAAFERDPQGGQGTLNSGKLICANQILPKVAVAAEFCGSARAFPQTKLDDRQPHAKHEQNGERTPQIVKGGSAQLASCHAGNVPNPDVIGINVGISMLMAANLRSQFVWRTFAKSGEVAKAMKILGFSG
jgi:hypothetical protein